MQRTHSCKIALLYFYVCVNETDAEHKTGHSKARKLRSGDYRQTELAGECILPLRQPKSERHGTVVPTPSTRPGTAYSPKTSHARDAHLQHLRTAEHQRRAMETPEFYLLFICMSMPNPTTVYQYLSSAYFHNINVYSTSYFAHVLASVNWVTPACQQSTAFTYYYSTSERMLSVA